MLRSAVLWPVERTALVMAGVAADHPATVWFCCAQLHHSVPTTVTTRLLPILGKCGATYVHGLS